MRGTLIEKAGMTVVTKNQGLQAVSAALSTHGNPSDSIQHTFLLARMLSNWQLACMRPRCSTFTLCAIYNGHDDFSEFGQE